ncbi:MAG: hypothetical protein WD068_02800 [Candidatus Babeliales bacterium]
MAREHSGFEDFGSIETSVSEYSAVVGEPSMFQLMSKPLMQVGTALGVILGVIRYGSCMS